MGLALCLRRVDAADLQRLLERPAEVEDFLLGVTFPAAEPLPATPPISSKSTEYVQALLADFSIPGEPPLEIKPSNSFTVSVERQRAWDLGEEIDVDKDWHVIHFLLTGSAQACDRPEGSLLADDRPIGVGDVGVGRPWALLPDEIARFAQAISDFRYADMTDRFDIGEMLRQDVYSAGAVENESWCLDSLWKRIGTLRDFVTTASRNGQGVILFMV